TRGGIGCGLHAAGTGDGAHAALPGRLPGLARPCAPRVASGSGAPGAALASRPTFAKVALVGRFLPVRETAMSAAEIREITPAEYAAFLASVPHSAFQTPAWLELVAR